MENQTLPNMTEVTSSVAEHKEPKENESNAYMIQRATNLYRQLNSGSSWFYWIAALSLVNTFAYFGGGNFSFVIGLGITDYINQIIEYFFPNLIIIALLLDAFVAGLYFIFGYFSKKKHMWAFIMGMILYFLDALLLILVADWVSIAFHGLALFYIFKGFQASKELLKIGA